MGLFNAPGLKLPPPPAPFDQMPGGPNGAMRLVAYPLEALTTMAGNKPRAPVQPQAADTGIAAPSIAPQANRWR
jgi:hypothetical protein